jgi:hypothetical protein
MAERRRGGRGGWQQGCIFRKQYLWNTQLSRYTKNPMHTAVIATITRSVLALAVLRPIADR